MTNSGVRLSVIIPGYNNSQEYWERCIRSVMGNIGSNDEIFCVDDGSSVRPQFLNDFAAKDSRIHVLFLPENVGLPSARNAALELARGEYVTFVDSDDELIPGIYAVALSALCENRVDIAVFGVESIWVNERLHKVNVPPQDWCGILSVELVKSLYDNMVLNYAWNKVYRRDFLTDNRLRFDKDGVPCEDIIFILKCILSRAKWFFVRQVGIKYYRSHNTLLSRYKSTYVNGTRLANEAWRKYKEAERGECVLGKIGEITDAELMAGEWDNIWRLSSPYSYRERFVFAREHHELYSGAVYVFFIRKLVYSFVRKWFYVRPVQRWHIKRTYLDAKDYCG